MNKHASKQATTVLALAALLGGCAAPAPHWDQQFGSSVRAAVDAQVVNPAAALNVNPVYGMDGPSARAAQAAYQASFATPKGAEPAQTSGSAK